MLVVRTDKNHMSHLGPMKMLFIPQKHWIQAYQFYNEGGGGDGDGDGDSDLGLISVHDYYVLECISSRIAK